MKHNLLKSLIISVILLTGVSNAWGDDTRQFLIGDATGGNWNSNKFAYPVDSYYGQDNKCCIYVWLQTGQHFAFCNYAGSQYGPKINNSEPIYDGSAIHDNDNGRGAYEQYDQDGNKIKDNHGNAIPTTNAWKYTGNTGLVRICVDYSFEGNVWRPYVWVEELTNVLKGTEVMFYFGDTWGSSLKYIRSANTTNDKDIKFVGQAGFDQLDSQNTYSTCCKVPIGQYWISNTSTWGGEQMHQATEGGAMHSLTSNGYGNNHINVIPGVKPIWTPNESKIQVDKGTTNSGITATCDNSVIGKTNTIYYCYTQDNENYYRFDPTDISNLDCGTYTVWAIACDGHIVVRSAEPKILQVGYTVTLAGTDYGKYTVICGNREETITTETVTIDVPTGTQLTITDIQPKTEGYDQTMVYSLDDGANYTYFSDSTEIDGKRTYTYTVNSDVTIAEDFRTTDSRVVYIKVTYKPYWHWCTINDETDVFPRIIYYNGVNQNRLHNEANLVPFDLLAETNQYNIYGVKIPKGYNSFKLYPGKSFSEYGGTEEVFSYQIIPEDPLKNCFEFDNVENNTGPKPTGKWVGATITAKSTGSSGNNTIGIGRYGIEYNRDTSYATTTQDAKFDVQVPYGGNIELRALKGEPGNEAYTGYLIMNDIDTIYFSNGATDTLMNINVTRDIEFDDFFVTKEPHIVYLGVPEGVKNSWQYNDNTNKSLAYAEHQYNTSKGAICLQEISTTKNGTTYYKFTIPAGWNNFRFELKSPELHDKYGNAPIHATIRFPYGIPTDENNCFTLTGKEGYEFQGTWGKAPTCHIKAGYTDVGRYGIKDHNGEIHYAVDGIDAEFDVPFGSQVEVLEGEPGNSVYTGTIGLRGPDNSTIKQKFHDGINNNNFVTIVKDTMFDDLFGLKEKQIVYLGIPDAILPYWEECSNLDHTETNHDANVRPYIWHHTPYGPSDLLVDEPEIFKYNHTTFYKYTLPVGISSFHFQSKEGDNSNSPHAEAKRQYYPPIPYKNCFMLDGGKNGNEYTGRWIPLPLAEAGDYRVLYAEKKLIKTREEGETEDWETAFRTVYEHPSDIIKQTLGTVSKNTVSLHITTTQERDGKKVHPMVILQQFRLIEGNTYDWVNLQAHTVLPLKATGNMGMLPGRKKAFGDLPFYDDGIEVIKNYTQYEDCTDDEGNSYKGSGVWNFVVNQASDGSVELDLSQTEPYRGKYYIRTNNAPGYWENYKRPEHEITYSSYAEQHSGFSHYYCKWIDRSKADSDVSFIIANDYATNLSDPSYLFDDQHITNEWIPENVNIRWAWEHMTNKVSRAYIRGTWNTNEPPARIENIVVDYTPAEGANPEQKLLYDSGDWIYSINLEDMKVGSKLNTLTAQYPSDGYTQTFAENINMLVGDYDNKKSYIVRILYDFKIDKTLVALVPNENAATVGIDVLIERIDQGPATQVVAQVDSKKNNSEGSTVYGAFTFTQPHLTSTKLSEQEKLTYWFSFPFDVLLSDVYGFGEVGKYWMIKEYDGESRAKVGLTEDNTFWKFITKKSTVLQANKGYVLTLNKRLMNEDDVVYTNTDSICLYFPSQNLVTSIDNGFTVEEDQLIAIPQWTGETAQKEWNWNLIGIPSYANKQETITADHLYYFFDYKHSNDTYEVMYLGDHTFKSTFAYMVQFAGNINWHTFTTTPKQLAAQKDTSAEINHVMRLELLRNNQREDKTYIQLTENENATEQFDMNFDLTKMANAKANLYSLIGNHQLAANVLPLQTTVVPLGVIIKTAGEYTFSMPDGTDGIIAELIDYQTNTRTNLLLDNYTVTLPAGTNNSRFALSLQPDKTVTSVDNIGNEATGDKVKKYLIDGKLYLQKDGVLYDAQGHAL